MDPGELVETTRQDVEVAGSKWEFIARVYLASNWYNITPTLEERDLGMFESGEQHSLITRRVDEKEDVEEEIQDMFETMVKRVAKREEMRDISVDVMVE